MLQSVWYLILASLTRFGHYAFSMVRPIWLKSLRSGVLCVLVLLVFMSLITSVSTVVEQVAACALVTQRTRVRSPVVTGFLGEVFRGFSLPVKQMSGNVRPRRFPNIIWPSSSFHIRLVGMTECAWRVLSFMFVLSREAPAFDWSLIRGPLHVLVWSRKYVCDP